MQDRVIMRSFRDLCKEAFPADVTATVVRVQGGEVELSTMIGAEAVWSGGVIEFTSGSVIGLTAAIANNRTDAVTCAGVKFTANCRPDVGDSVKLSAGPLKDARIYLDDPDSVKSDIDNNVNFFVTINSVEGDTSFKTLAGRTKAGEGRLDDFYGFEITVETPYVTGTPSLADVRRIQNELPTLRDQIISLIFNFVLNIISFEWIKCSVGELHYFYFILHLVIFPLILFCSLIICLTLYQDY